MLPPVRKMSTVLPYFQMGAKEDPSFSYTSERVSKKMFNTSPIDIKFIGVIYLEVLIMYKPFIRL